MDDFTANKIKQLEERIQSLIEQYKAVSNQHDRELNDGNKVLHKKEMKRLEEEIKEVEQDLNKTKDEHKELENTPKPKPPKLLHLLPVFLGAGTIVLLVGLFILIYIKFTPKPIEPVNGTISTNSSTLPTETDNPVNNNIKEVKKLSDKELRTLGASNTLQIIATLKDETKRYGSATVFKKTEKYFIIVTAYHILQGVKTFEIAAHHLEAEENFATISSSELEVYVESIYDLVLIQLELTDEIKKDYPWLSKAQPVKHEGCDDLSLIKYHTIFGLPSFSNNIRALDFTLSSGAVRKESTSCVQNERDRNKIEILFFDQKTELGMGGGPIIDKTDGCFQGMLLGENPDANTIALYSKEIKVVFNRFKFQKFDERQFTKNLCWIQYKN